MIDIDYIKWEIGYAEGFWCQDGSVGFNNDASFNINNIKEEWFKSLLRERAIEGINEARDDIEIYQNKYCIWMRRKEYDWWSNEISFYFKPNPGKDMDGENIYKSIYQAKEEALKYIYEKEKA